MYSFMNFDIFFCSLCALVPAVFRNIYSTSIHLWIHISDDSQTAGCVESTTYPVLWFPMMYRWYRGDASVCLTSYWPSLVRAMKGHLAQEED